jgi:glycine/D-amino acid oxidase-like deaminating enzyme
MIARGRTSPKPAIYTGERKAEVVIVGGGIYGLFTALNLAELGKSVTLLDRLGIWSEASAVNAGSLGVQNKLPELVPYTLSAWQIWLTLAERLGKDVGVRRDGGYKVAMTEAEAERLAQIAREQEARGLRVHWLSRTELRKRAPWISPNVVAATFSPDDGYASPTLLGPALRRAVGEAGVEIIEQADVVSVKGGRTLSVETTKGDFRADVLAITAGAWSGRIAAMVGCRLPISLDVNMVSVTEPAGPTIGNIVTHARGILTLKQVANGSCLIGGGWQGVGTLADGRKEINYDQLVHNLRLAVRVVPGLAKLNLIRSWAGYEGVTPDSLPYLGRLGQHPNIYCAACARGGFTLGPLMGQLLAELIATGSTSKPIAIFDPQRFAHG